MCRNITYFIMYYVIFIMKPVCIQVKELFHFLWDVIIIFHSSNRTVQKWKRVGRQRETSRKLASSERKWEVTQLKLNWCLSSNFFPTDIEYSSLRWKCDNLGEQEITVLFSSNIKTSNPVSVFVHQIDQVLVYNAFHFITCQNQNH